MKNEMIERVAKALYNSCISRSLISHPVWEHIDKQNQLSWMEDARAAIQAMYVPTDQQCNFYFDLKRKTGSTPAYSTFEDATWEMMILACLLQDTIDETS